MSYDVRKCFEVRATLILGKWNRPSDKACTITIPVMTLSFRTDISGQTVQTQPRLLLKVQSDQGLHCLLFHLHIFDEIA